MAISFQDQLMAYLALPANQAQFANLLALSAFASKSFARRFAQNGFQINAVNLGAPSGFRLQELLASGARVAGFREKRSEQPQRHWYDLKVGVQEPMWVDAVFDIPADLVAVAFPGSIQLGPNGGLAQAGVSDPSPSVHTLQFQVPVTTTALALNYQARCFVFAAADPSPVDDLRRIALVRQVVDQDGAFLASLDGTADQKPPMFIQVYPAGVLGPAPVSQAAVVAAFDATDVLAAFVGLPDL